MTFDTPISLTGPWRSPRQLLDDQTYGGHASVHDEAQAEKLGLRGAPIEGPTHFSQFDPLAVHLWGQGWFERGCISAHFRTMVTEGEQVRASLTPSADGPAAIEAVTRDGSPVLTGTASGGPDHGRSELDERLARAGEPGELFIVDQLEVGMTTTEAAPQSVTADGGNGDLYPFSLARKLETITERTPWYDDDRASPWGRAILPTEMISVLAHKGGAGFPVRGPSIGLFLDLEVRYLAGPVFVGEAYEVRHEVVGLGQSRRTESYWTRSTITDGDGRPVASVLLHSGVFKDSYDGYPKDRLG